MTSIHDSDILVYQAPDGAIELHSDKQGEKIWATQAQIVALFGVHQSVVSRHIRNIFRDEEIDPESNMQKMHIANSDKPVSLYSLDVILAVGYRTNSKVAIAFRQWATQTLRQHITEGYTINRNLLEKNYSLFQKALAHIQNISHQSLSTDDALELVRVFSTTWFSLDAFDRASLQSGEQTKTQIMLEANELARDVETLKKELIQKGEATELFAQEKSPGTLQGIFGNIFQSAFGEDAYPSIESKASHLLYFVVKNHPFTDGNKRSGAFAFVWFLQKADYPFREKITPEALTAITLLIATSDPKDKERIVDLLILLLSGK